MLKMEYELILSTDGLINCLLIQYIPIITRNKRHGIRGGYILKLSVNLPCSNNRTARWKPQKGQSIPNKSLNVHGRR